MARSRATTAAGGPSLAERIVGVVAPGGVGVPGDEHLVAGDVVSDGTKFFGANAGECLREKQQQYILFSLKIRQADLRFIGSK